jgi:anaerobic glycerol-3-phosphate dehydrogenase
MFGKDNQDSEMIFKCRIHEMQDRAQWHSDKGIDQSFCFED